MEYPINESSILIVITGIGVTALVGMFVHLSITSILQRSSNELNEQHFSRD
jgi:hypothetical protein